MECAKSPDIVTSTTVRMAKMPKRLYCVEGAIGIGKTTLIHNLKRSAPEGVAVLFEPVEEWTSVIVDKGTNKNLLQAMYDGTISPGVFQLGILQSRFSLLVKTLCDPNIHTVISERGPWSEKYVFAKSNLTECDFSTYIYTQRAMMDTLFDIVGPLSVSFLYLTLDRPAVLERIRERGRPEEAGITDEYLAKLDVAHAEMETEIRKEGTNLKHIVGPARHVHLDASVSEQQLHDEAFRLIYSSADANGESDVQSTQATA